MQSHLSSVIIDFVFIYFYCILGTFVFVLVGKYVLMKINMTSNATDEATITSDFSLTSLYTSWYTSLTLFTLAFIVHATGLTVIFVHRKTSKKKVCNQTTIICNLCIIEMLCIIYNITHDTIASMNFKVYFFLY